MKKFLSTPILALAGVLLLPGLASAHIIPGTNHGFQSGFAHPFSGMDHLLAMFAVGLWAAQHRGRAVWMIPLAFVSIMALGGAMGMAGGAMPGVELGIAFSVLILGGLIATSTHFTPTVSMAVVGLFAMFHGYAHGHEMQASLGAVSYSFGFMTATLLLHGAGIMAGIYFQNQTRAVRLAGAAIAACSICFFVN